MTIQKNIQMKSIMDNLNKTKENVLCSVNPNDKIELRLATDELSSFGNTLSSMNYRVNRILGSDKN